ncbi:MAG: TonB family protein [Verrucomicrobiota bacterium]|jgi:TonB family protein
MNRLQKKCVIALAGVHLLLIVILFVGPAFFYSRPKADDLQVLDVIPAHLIDAAFNSGVANAQPPPPAPATPPQPPPPTPVFTPPPPTPEKIVKAEPVKPPDKLSPDNLTPVEKTSKTEPRKIQISTQLVARAAPKNSPAADNSQQRLARASQSVLQKLKNNLTPGTTIDMPGNSSVAYADYGQAVKSKYDQAWSLPANIANDNENVIVNVTIASDGTVISARIVTPSGDANVDASVQHTLERVKFIAPFPNGAPEKERSYTINFNPKAKRILE